MYNHSVNYVLFRKDAQYAGILRESDGGLKRIGVYEVTISSNGE